MLSRLMRIVICAAMFGIHSTSHCPGVQPIAILARDNSTKVELQTASPIGNLDLWAPEAIMSERGVCALYPKGAKWQALPGGVWQQSIGVSESFGPGNYTRRGNEIECVGVQYPVDMPVSWITRLMPGPRQVDVEIRLRNTGNRPIRRAAAAVCVRFLDAAWWSDEATITLVDKKPISLAELGRDNGPDKRFEAYMLSGQNFPNPFYEQFWGFNKTRIDRPVLVSEHRAARWCAVVSSERAYFVHSCNANPCTDLMLAFGDIAPGAGANARGTVSVVSGDAESFFKTTEQPKLRDASHQPPE